MMRLENPPVPLPVTIWNLAEVKTSSPPAIQSNMTALSVPVLPWMVPSKRNDPLHSLTPLAPVSRVQEKSTAATPVWAPIVVTSTVPAMNVTPFSVVGGPDKTEGATV